MATRRWPTTAADRDISTEKALARSREIRERGKRQMQAAQEHVAAASQRRSGARARSWPLVQNPAAQVLDAHEQIERSKQARANLAAVAAKLVQTEEAVAHLHDEMAKRDSPYAVRYHQAADDARQAARRAREIQRGAADPG